MHVDVVLVDVAVRLKEPGTVVPHYLVKVDPLNGSFRHSLQPSQCLYDGHLHTEDARDQVDLHHLDDIFLLPVGALAVNHRGWGVGSAGGKLVMRCVMPMPLRGGLKECDIKAVLGNSGEILRSLDSFPENWKSIEDLFRMKNGQCTNPVDMQ